MFSILFMIKKIETPSYIIDKKTIKRFNQRQTIFGRKLHDPRADFYKKGMYDNSSSVISKNKVGYSRIDFARMISSWTVYDYFHDAFSWDKLTEVDPIMDKPIFTFFFLKCSIKGSMSFSASR